jgi:cytochrome c oxidase subunit 1
MPTYIAYYTIFPRAIGGRLYSDAMARIAFILFVVVAMPIGVHHLFADPQVGAGFKFIQSVFTAVVALPTLVTVFTICASAELAGRLRGGRGPFGWIAALPWDNPMMLAVTFSFVMLGFGGAGGLINMSYQLDASVHNTQWITGHFHLIFAGAIVIMYFAIAYDLWPHLTGRALDSARLIKGQLWLWFVGMIVTTFPWHYVGVLGMPRRMASYDYANPDIAPQALSVSISVFGGLLLVVSAVLFFGVLIRSHRAPQMDPGEYRFSVAVHEPVRVPIALNGFALWLTLMIALTAINYGYPIVQLLTLKGNAVPAVYVGAAR